MRFLQSALLILPAVLAAPVAYDGVDECEVDPTSTVETSSTVATTVAVESTSSAVVASSTISSTLASVVSSSVSSSGSSVASSAVASTTVAAVNTSASSSSSALVSASSSVVASSSSSAATSTATGNSTAGLNTYAQAKGLVYFGTATDNPELTDTAYVTILNETSQFGQLTPGNSQKWDATEATQGVFTYTEGDAIVDLAEANGQKMRCHNLVWYNQLPSWVTSGTWTNETLIAAMQNHITNLVTYWGSSCYAWDVVNEPFNDNGTYRSDIFYDTIGPEYIPIAFAAATAAAPSDVKLYLNEYNIEYAGTKATAVEDLVTDLKSRSDLRIDGVGLQSHFIVGSTPSQSSQSTQMAAFVALDVEVAITELDIRMELPATTALLDQQAIDYNSTVSACVETTGCIGVTIWDYTDKYSWVPNTFSGEGEACPWDEDLVEKPAYDGIVSALTSTS